MKVIGEPSPLISHFFRQYVTIILIE